MSRSCLFTQWRQREVGQAVVTPTLQRHHSSGGWFLDNHAPGTLGHSTHGIGITDRRSGTHVAVN